MTKLTTDTYIKIALVVLLCLVLCGGIASCSVGCSAVSARVAGDMFDDEWRSAEFVQRGNATVDAAQVRNIEISWLAGQVDIVAVDDAETDGKVVAAEQVHGSIPENQKMAWQMDGDTLQIGYGYEMGGFWGCTPAGSKSLTVRIPKSAAGRLGQLELAGASGTYDLSDITCDELDVELASGKLNGTGLTAKTLDLSLASGNVDLAGAFEDACALDVASGDVTVTSRDVCPKRCTIEVASGNVAFAIPKDSGFVADVRKMSGSFTCEFPESRVQQSDDRYTCGDGASKLTVEMASGNVVLRPA